MLGARVLAFPAPGKSPPYPISDITGLQTALNNKSDKYLSFVTVGGASKTLALADDSVVQETTAGAAITVPADGSVNFTVGTVIPICWLSGAQPSVVAAGGVTIQDATKLKVGTQYKFAFLVKRAANNWLFTGDTAA